MLLCGGYLPNSTATQLNSPQSRLIKSDCCCPPRHVITTTKYYATVTVTRSARRYRATGKSPRIWIDPLIADPVRLERRQGDSRQGDSRHLCPVCPAGVDVLGLAAGKTGGESRFCCKGQRTVTKSMKKTVTKTRTARVSWDRLILFKGSRDN